MALRFSVAIIGLFLFAASAAEVRQLPHLEFPATVRALLLVTDHDPLVLRPRPLLPSQRQEVLRALDWLLQAAQELIFSFLIG